MLHINEQVRAEEAHMAYQAKNPMDTEVTAKLAALGADTSPETVSEVLGNESYTWVICSICGYRVDDVVRVGSNVDVCEDCLKDALKLLEGK